MHALSRLLQSKALQAAIAATVELLLSFEIVNWGEAQIRSVNIVIVMWLLVARVLFEADLHSYGREELSDMLDMILTPEEDEVVEEDPGMLPGFYVNGNGHGDDV